MRILTLSLMVACTGASLPAAAQTTLKPGLWEIQHKTSGKAEASHADAEMQKQMAAMPPEQRKQMEAMMAGRGGAMAPADKMAKPDSMAKPAADKMEKPGTMMYKKDAMSSDKMKK